MAFIELDDLKDDLGITGAADDAWLGRRIDEILEAMRNYTHRYIGDVVTFEDDFTRIVNRGQLWVAPPYPSLMRVVPRLAQAPVVSIVSATKDGATLDPAKILYDPRTGEILALDGAPAIDVSRALVGSIVIRYTAGWAEIPKDLYAALVGIIRDKYQLRKAAAGGMELGGLAIEQITVPDVGAVTLGGGSTGFEAQAAKGTVDPILGPWRTTLDPYFRPVIGDVGAPISRIVPP